MRTGQISVQSENIFPIIKKFLYTDQEIFIRELISNAVDATKKLTTLSRVGEVEESIENCKIEVSFDEKAKTLTISDSGIGMTEEEVEKYITQLAFSGASEFAEKWKDKDPEQMIGHFGLGFYSAFMVSKHVSIETKSFQKGSTAVHWDCDGATSYNIGKGKRKKRGTDVILQLTDEDAETYLSKWKIRELLRKYCRFLPVPIVFYDEDINNTQPIWTKKPAELNNEDYKKFFEELYPMQEASLFHIHINTDYPFNLTGVLYFPKVTEAIDNRQNRVQLYCNQVFVTEDVKDVLPEYLVLLKGVIDSPDIPLNVSRSALQSDSNVKKITQHISKKVSDKLAELFKDDRVDFDSKWEYLDLFVKYGMVSDEKFSERTKDICLVKTTEGGLHTIQEWIDHAKINQTDKNAETVVLYTTDMTVQHMNIKAAKDKGYEVIVLNGPLDTHFAGWVEGKFEKVKFRCVDGGPMDQLIEKEISIESALTSEQQKSLEDSVKIVVNELAFEISVQSLPPQDDFISVHRSEWERRMEDMAKMGQGFPYGDMGLKKQTMVVNSNHALASKVLSTEGNDRNELLQYCMDLAMLQRGQLQGESLERFLKKAQGFIGA
ncbi:MAG: molecular chaperone HtpG [Flavobacteriaceae bacterium]|nr:molecular chaperone HtpG [Flavobacteriaceae bacterium]